MAPSWRRLVDFRIWSKVQLGNLLYSLVFSLGSFSESVALDTPGCLYVEVEDRQDGEKEEEEEEEETLMSFHSTCVACSFRFQKNCSGFLFLF